MSQWQVPHWPCHKQGPDPWERFYCSTLGTGTNETWVSFQIHALLGEFYTGALLRQCQRRPPCHGRGMTTPIREVTSTDQVFIGSIDIRPLIFFIIQSRGSRTKTFFVSNKLENQDVDVPGKNWKKTGWLSCFFNLAILWHSYCKAGATWKVQWKGEGECNHMTLFLLPPTLTIVAVWGKSTFYIFSVWKSWIPGFNWNWLFIASGESNLTAIQGVNMLMNFHTVILSQIALQKYYQVMIGVIGCFY